MSSAVFVKERNAFTHNGISAHIGRYAFGFTWGAWACLFLATLFLVMGTTLGGSSSSKHERTSPGSNVGFFRRQRSQKSARGSFVDNESQRRVVKEEY